MQDSLQIENIPTTWNKPGLIFLLSSKQPAINLAKKDIVAVFQRHYVLNDLL